MSEKYYDLGQCFMREVGLVLSERPLRGRQERCQKSIICLMRKERGEFHSK